ncbi:MAG TPA: hypothetical protein VG929_11985 [Actinomycetota bacterium]|nr:hypothetical protein [Actinomycetota bacterium]
MKKKMIVAGLTAALMGLMVLPGSHAIAAKKKPAGPVVVATDDPADWGANVDKTIAPAGTVLGMELVEAAIGLSEDKKAINFILKLNGPTSGGTPETVRYGWEFTVDGNAYQLNGGRTELLRGICNPLITDPACPPNVGDPAKLMNFPFFVRSGPCTVGAECVVEAVVNASFDVTTSTITIPVPLDVVGAKLGSTVGPSAGLFGAIYAAPGAVITTNGLPHDAIATTKPVKLPKK